MTSELISPLYMVLRREERRGGREAEVFEPGRRMRESELPPLLFQVILTQVACTRQSVGEEGVKVLPPVALASNMRRRAGGRAAWQSCVC